MTIVMFMLELLSSSYKEFKLAFEICSWVFRIWPMGGLIEGTRRALMLGVRWAGRDPATISDEQLKACRELYDTPYDEAKSYPRAFDCSGDILDQYGVGFAFYTLLIQAFVYPLLAILFDYSRQDIRLRQFWNWKNAIPDKSDPRYLRKFRYWI